MKDKCKDCKYWNSDCIATVRGIQFAPCMKLYQLMLYVYRGKDIAGIMVNGKGPIKDCGAFKRKTLRLDVQ